jgi:hypothetical protein
VLGGTEREPHVAVAQHCNEDNGNVAEVRVGGCVARIGWLVSWC